MAAKKGTGKSKTKKKAKRSGVPAPTAENTVKASEVKRTISGPALVKLLNADKARRRKTHDISMDFGKLMAAAVDNQHLDRKAYNIIRPLHTLEPDELRDRWDMVLHYFEISGLQERYDSAPALIEATEGQGEDESGEEDAQTDAFPTEPQQQAAE